MRTGARAALHMAALVVTWFNPVMKAFYMHLSAAGKTEKMTLVDRIRRLLTILNMMLERNEE